MADTARVIHPEFAPGRRILAVSDIHGNLPFFQGLLKQVNFTPEDILVLDGDILEKGRDSLALLRYVMELARTHTVYPVCGNCDGLVSRFFETDELDQGFYASYLPQHPESILRQLAEEMDYPDWRDFPGLRSALRARYPEIRAWLSGLPTILETEHLVFVHGGVPSLEHMEGLNRWRCMKNDDFRGQGHAFSKYVIVGHWPVTLYNGKVPSAAPIFDWDRKIVSIDGKQIGYRLFGDVDILDHGSAEPAVPVHVKPDGTTIDFWQWLDSLAPYEGGRDLLVKLAGAVVRYNYNWRVMVTLFNSSGKNGKSTFIRMLKACVGRGNCMSSTMGQLCDDRFALANLPGTVLVTCEDSDSGTYIRSTSRIKCIISHDPVVVERKGQDTFTYTPACMIVSASNDLPRTKDKTPAWQDRNIYVPFTAEFKGVADPTIASEWVVSEEFCQYMLYQALIKMDNYYELPEPDMAVALKQEFMAENDSVIEFLEWFEDLGTIDFLPNGYAWYLYREWLPKHRPNTSLPNEKAFLKHLAEVAVNSGRWLQPKEAGGRSCRFSVGAWCHCSDDVLDANVDRYSEPKTRGIVRNRFSAWAGPALPVSLR